MARMASRIRGLGLALVVSVALNATAARAEMPRYVDDDPAAKAYAPPPGQKVQFRQYLDAQLRAHPGHPILLVQRGHEHYVRGQFELGERDFERALAGVRTGSEAHRRVLWSRGWAYHRAGRHDDAILLWQEAARLHGGHPFWLPYSLAGAYAAKGEPAQAAVWFEAQVAADSTWSTEAGFQEHTRRWNEQRQQWMRLAFDAWQQRAASSVK